MNSFRKIPISRRKTLTGMGALGAAGLLPRMAIGQGQTLVINSNVNNPESRALLERMTAAFGKEFGCSVTINTTDPESYKTTIRNFLVTSPPDVCFWYSGERMRHFVRLGLFEDVTDVWEKHGFYEPTGALADSVTVDGRQYGVPTEAAFIGIFYRKDLFERAGIGQPPATWDELMAAGEALKKAGITPFAIGSRDLWPTGYFFDYINLRTNGLDFHMRLMAGQEAYTDPRVIKVFDRWAELVSAGFFTPNHTSYSWEQGATFFSQGQAGMIFLGQFARRFLPQEVIANTGFFPFPTLDPNVPQYEEFTANSMHVPSGAGNKELGKEFLAYFYRPENLQEWIVPEGYLPPRKDVEITFMDELLQSGLDMLAKAEGTAQFYDRDTNPEMAQIGMNGFQEFMVDPSRRDSILERLEAARKRIFEVQ
ncbi:extracellular solute-binding protein [Chelativorans sp.]|uniref:ABC transporter substrate-binding protein n=1 Tax=Chelativorans sp. TaxID=2203393 RepID=UPI00281134B0|nr:extracellular solute-binding protein [Chelativorans sp.]